MFNYEICKNCIYFTPNYKKINKITGKKEWNEDKIKMLREISFWEEDKIDKHIKCFGDCSCEKFDIGYLLNADEDGVNVEGDEGWGFEVGQFFGCIHFFDKLKSTKSSTKSSTSSSTSSSTYEYLVVNKIIKN